MTIFYKSGREVLGDPFVDREYDEDLLALLVEAETWLSPSPQRDAYRIMLITVQADLNRGVVLTADVARPILRGMQSIVDSEPKRMDPDLNALHEQRDAYEQMVSNFEVEITRLTQLEDRMTELNVRDSMTHIYTKIAIGDLHRAKGACQDVIDMTLDEITAFRAEGGGADDDAA